MAGLGGLVGGGALDEELKNSNVVRLRGLPFSATESEIEDFFKGLELGPDRVVICVNFQGRSTGQAYVEFASVEIADKALDRNRQHMGSRYIEVFKGHPSDMQGALRMVGRGNANGILSNSLINTRTPGFSGATDMGYTGVVRMRGMPYSCTSTDITAFFKDMQVVPDGVFICTHGDGRPTGEAFVEFANEDTASKAMQLHKKPMGSRYVELFKSSKGEMMTAMRQRMSGLAPHLDGYSMYGSVGQFPGMMGMLGLPGLGLMNLAAMNSGMGLTCGFQAPKTDLSENVCVKMRGLPYNAQTKDILEFFEGYKIDSKGILIMMGPDNRPTGEAFVEFVSPDEAQRAMERHKQNMGSRYIELFRATKSECMQAASGFPGLGMMDPSIQLLLLQQQAVMERGFGMGGPMGRQVGLWPDMGNAAAIAAGLYQRQNKFTGGSGPTITKNSSRKKHGGPRRSMS